MKLVVWAFVYFILLDDKKNGKASASFINACSTAETKLLDKGDSSSTTLTLTPFKHYELCKLHVTAPETHVINMQLVETNSEIKKSFNNSNQNHHPCIMSIFLPDNATVPYWKADLCGEAPVPEIDLLTPDFYISWQPPSKPYQTKGRKFVLTAVGQGLICNEPGHHICMRIGRIPLLCVSDHLLCDGHYNCPKPSTKSDEDENICKSHLPYQGSWEQIAAVIFKKLKPPSEITWSNVEANTKKTLWQELQTPRKSPSSTVKPLVASQKTTDSISQMLSKYGPWGYLMLGLLICGTVLMFCGFWECCFRKPKAQIESTVLPPPTTVLIINHQEEVSNDHPPVYEELDPPPSYTTLFPNFKANSSGDATEGNSGANSTIEITEET